FARWEAGQELATRQILALAARHQAGETLLIDAGFIDAWRALLTDPALDAGYRARALALPSEKTLAERQDAIDPPALAFARDFLRVELGRQLSVQWRGVFDANQTPGAYSPAPGPAGQRALKNQALNHLMAAGIEGAQALAQSQFDQAGNMTDSLAALGALVN